MGDTLRIGGGLLFPEESRGAGTYITDIILMPSTIKPPFGVHVVTDVAMTVFFDVEVDGVFREGMFSQALTALDSPASIQVNYTFARFKIRFVTAGAGIWGAQMDVLKDR